MPGDADGLQAGNRMHGPKPEPLANMVIKELITGWMVSTSLAAMTWVGPDARTKGRNWFRPAVVLNVIFDPVGGFANIQDPGEHDRNRAQSG